MRRPCQSRKKPRPCAKRIISCLCHHILKGLSHLARKSKPSHSKAMKKGPVAVMRPAFVFLPGFVGPNLKAIGRGIPSLTIGLAHEAFRQLVSTNAAEGPF